MGWAIRHRLGIAKYGKIYGVNFGVNMSAKAKVSGSVVAGFPSPAECIAAANAYMTVILRDFIARP